MTSGALDIVGIGNAIVDIIAEADDRFLEIHGMAKGAMTLIDEARAEAIYAAISGSVEISGGSAANTIAGIASLGGKAGFIGKVKDDALGAAFRRDIEAAGIVFPTVPDAEGPATARCMILVTGDAQRTMNTYLGACVNLMPADIDEELIRRAEVTYLEGYLFDPPHAKLAFRKAAKLAHASGRKVALSLSDAFCVNRHRAEFLDLVEHDVDILFGNESEIAALFECELEQAVSRARHLTDFVAVTLGADGSVIATPDEVVTVPAAPVAKVIDTTGAGDLYASGVLRGITTGRSPAECGRLGSLCAAEIISHVGARPEVSLAGLVG